VFIYYFIKTYRVIHEQNDVPLVASVKENGSALAIPVPVNHDVSLLERILIGVAKMIHLKGPKNQRSNISSHYITQIVNERRLWMNEWIKLFDE